MAVDPLSIIICCDKALQRVSFLVDVGGDDNLLDSLLVVVIAAEDVDEPDNPTTASTRSRYSLTVSVDVAVVARSVADDNGDDDDDTIVVVGGEQAGNAESL